MANILNDNDIFDCLFNSELEVSDLPSDNNSLMMTLMLIQTLYPIFLYLFNLFIRYNIFILFCYTYFDKKSSEKHYLCYYFKYFYNLNLIVFLYF